ncbi:MAG TPA: F0F1 ATP synthase subunit gamma [Syntrophales bacterium]|nr:F0F1 ATP synthase subunit gamma [Syntrophales bacterium]
METLEKLNRRRESTRDLQSVVKTMKALAAVRIRQYERAVESLGDYTETVEKGLRAVLLNRPGLMVTARPGQRDTIGAVVFGSDQGMCGQLNDQVASHALAEMNRFNRGNSENRVILAVGDRLRGRLEDGGQAVDEGFSVPGSVTGITPLVQDVLSRIEGWHEKKGLEQVFLYYSEHLSGASYRPRTVHLLPIDRLWLARIREKGWAGRSLPLFTMDWDSLFSALIREYLFGSLFRAFAESLASENASRLASMEGAERNIREQLKGLDVQYHQQRQMSITEELLDIVSGFEALEAGDGKNE